MTIPEACLIVLTACVVALVFDQITLAVLNRQIAQEKLDRIKQCTRRDRKEWEQRARQGNNGAQ